VGKKVGKFPRISHDFQRCLFCISDFLRARPSVGFFRANSTNSPPVNIV
jgi:hypothetical protein